MKECRSCKISKLEDEFYLRSSNLDGLYSYCKECTLQKNKNISHEQKVRNRKKIQEYRKKNRKILNQKSKEYYHKNKVEILKKSSIYRQKNKINISIREALKRITDEDRFEKNRESHLAWSKKNRKKVNEYQKQWYQKNKEKRRAHVIISRTVNSGKIMRPKNCSQCNKECKPDGHHIDYNKPLDVVWICRACHSRKSIRTLII